LTYTPSLDRILPPPTHLQVKIKNTSAAPLRAAYLHGPYSLYVACYPSTYDPYKKYERQKEEGIPDFEPQVKAGGSWCSKLTVPEEVRQDAENIARSRQAEAERKSFTWVIEVASQVSFTQPLLSISKSLSAEMRDPSTWASTELSAPVKALQAT
jgi:hypothetical protein